MALSVSPAVAWERSDKPDRCAFGQTFDGPGSTTVAFFQNREMVDEDLIAVLVSNENWSVKAGDVVKQPIKFSAVSYEFWGDAEARDNGLLIYVETPHVRSFAQSLPGLVSVWKGDTLIDRLNFSDFWYEFSVLDKCTAKWREEKDERERQKSLERDLPRDPFAGD